MKKILLTAILISFLMVPMVNVLAQEHEVNEGIDIENVLTKIINYLTGILLLVAAIFIIFAAYSFVTAAGEPEAVAKARNYVLYALIGIAVALASRGLVELIRKIVEG